VVGWQDKTQPAGAVPKLRAPRWSKDARPVRRSSKSLRNVCAVALLAACNSAAPGLPGPAGPLSTRCEELVAANAEAFRNPSLQSGDLYGCQLAEAFDQFVQDKDQCAQDGDCVFVPGACRINGASVNRTYEEKVTAVRNRLAAAYYEVSVCSPCGAFGTAAGPTCVGGRCE
jgi:hypothetical protein